MKPNHRRCISCRLVAPKAQFLRVVRHSTGEVALNQGMGRSAYICPNSDCLSFAQKKRRLEKALKCAIAPSLYPALWNCIAVPPEQNPR